jgi:hypothetical protein
MKNIYQIKYIVTEKIEILEVKLLFEIDKKIGRILKNYGIHTPVNNPQIYYNNLPRITYLYYNTKFTESEGHTYFNKLLKQYLRIQKLNELYE